MIEYREVPGYPEYRVGSDGSVWSRYSGKRGHKGCKLTDNWKQLNPSARKGYRVVNICSGGKRRTWLVHRLVALAFIGPEPAGHEVCHANGNPADNRAENLRYGTRKENMADQLNHGTRNRGEKQGLCKLTEGKVRDIRKLYATGQITQRELAVTYGVHIMNINFIVNRKSWAWLED